MRDFVQELRLALRMLAKHPGFTVVAVLTLALGIAANTAIFSVVDAVLFAPLPYAEPDRLVMVWGSRPESSRETVAPADFLDWRAQADGFEALAAFSHVSFNLAGDGTPETLPGASVSINFFQVLGARAALGSTFDVSGNDAGAWQRVVLSHALWQRRFGGDRSIIGRTVRLNDVSYEVIGVMPEHFDWPAITPTRAVSSNVPELWVPAVHRDVPQLGPDAMQDVSVWRTSRYLRVVGRLKPGVTLEGASRSLELVAARLTAEFPESHTNLGVRLVPLREQIVGPVQPVLWVLLAATGLVLAIGCANVANLFLARASARRQELTVRVALGARRSQLVRQLLTESVLLALVAGALGLLLALWSMDALLSLVPPELPRLGAVRMDGRVLTFTLLMSLGTGVLFGLVPALQASTPDLNGVLRQGGGGRFSGARNRSRSALVVGEVALAVVLLIGAGLLLRSLWSLQSVETGFRSEGVLTWTLSLPKSDYPDDVRQAALFHQVLERVEALPGVTSAGAISDLPFRTNDISVGLEIDGRPPEPGAQAMVGYQVITPGYFRTLGIPLLAGRDITASDRKDTQPVLLVNETAARRYWPGEDAVGRRIRVGSEDGPWQTVIGVVRDVRQGGPQRDIRPEVYVPALQQTFHFIQFAVRTEGDPLRLVAGVREALAAVDADLPMSQVRTMDEVVTTATARPRFLSTLVALFAALALLLAGVGLSGVIAYMARQRTQEIGIRMALGARPADVLRLVVGSGMRLALAGVGLGLGVACVATRVMASQLHGVSATDPLTFGSLALLVLGVTLVATWVPALRATRVDPLVAMRSE
ncbi:ABC transporter permease [Myxococcus sp. RHSTA-1-4]|uniref:ABC transporter permease n=1 Tax=Myxococcus sp. RHSTA-1-4 TaxID=2874601 RepID=UPI001CBC077D|nr:ABC transporter permease [Myxococcus sp. RHSTA-1-4]MBZ4416901.1 ABC transporter permease [Myxococcus sp. RHSTA-1-4]